LCNEIDHPDCINPCRGSTSGMTWEQRRVLGDTDLWE